MERPLPPDQGWIPFLKLLYGFFVTALIVGLALAVALGKVNKDTSYGLDGIVAGLSFLLAQFAQRAFGGRSRADEENKS